MTAFASEQSRLQERAAAEPARASLTRLSTPLLQRACACGGECGKCRSKRPDEGQGLMRARRGGSRDADEQHAPPIVEQVLRSPGAPLDPADRTFFEQRFGHDFGRVRVHTDVRAAESARAVDARAYTVGQDVVFGAGQYAPGAEEGRRLLAHELTHVVQQHSAAPRPASSSLKMSRPADASEREADALAGSVAEGSSLRPSVREGLGLSRQTNAPPTPAPAPGVSPPPPPLPEPELSPGCPSGDWPPPGWLTATPGKYSSSFDASLVAKMQESYKEHKKDKMALADGFAGTDPRCPAYWPKTFWDAVDKIPRTYLAIMVEVSKRAMLYPTLWGKIERIRNVWNTSSQGFKFHTASEADVKTFLKGSPSFCRDNPLTEEIFHGGQDCWREVGRAGKPGLHVCLAAGQPPDIHLDPNQIAEGKDDDGSCNIDWIAWGAHVLDQ